MRCTTYLQGHTTFVGVAKEDCQVKALLGLRSNVQCETKASLLHDAVRYTDSTVHIEGWHLRLQACLNANGQRFDHQLADLHKQVTTPTTVKATKASRQAEAGSLDKRAKERLTK